jgi:hypothetical protein
MAKDWNFPFPVTVVEVFNKVAGADIEFGPKYTKIHGCILENAFIFENPVAIGID